MEVCDDPAVRLLAGLLYSLLFKLLSGSDASLSGRSGVTTTLSARTSASDFFCAGDGMSWCVPGAEKEPTEVNVLPRRTSTSGAITDSASITTLIELLSSLQQFYTVTSRRPTTDSIFTDLLSTYSYQLVT